MPDAGRKPTALGASGGTSKSEAVSLGASGRQATPERLRCACHAPTGERCPWPATQEDGLCNVCRDQPCPAWEDDDA